MSGKFSIQILQGGQPAYEGEFTGAVEIGRQERRPGKPLEEIFTPFPNGNQTRLVIAKMDEVYIGRHQLVVESTGPHSLRVNNTSDTNPLNIVGHPQLGTKQSKEYDLPIEIQFSTKRILIESVLDSDFRSLAYRSMAPGSMRPSVALESRKVLNALRQAGAENLGQWLEALVEVMQSASESEEFYHHAARALVDLVGMDQGAVLLRRGREGNEWDVKVRHPAPLPGAVDAWTPSLRVLRRILDSSTAVGEVNRSGDMMSSLHGVRGVVAAPILDPRGDVIGALYGDRRAGMPGLPEAVSEHELMIVKLLACGVASGLAREKHEKEAMAARTRFEQFFTKDLADELAAKGDLLEAKNTNVTLLFCDLRGFSTVTENLGAQKTMKWINSVLTVLSDCVLAEGGVVIDYIGDELFAMWGAPKAQPDHAMRACRAAQAMLNARAKIDGEWLPVVGLPTRYGIGINSGVCQVGNTGSEVKFKYGALGPDVNLASRIRGATKYFGTELIITDSTKSLVGDLFPSRRLCDVKVINIERPVTVHELWAEAPAGWESLKKAYEEALATFERADFRECARQLGQLFQAYADDGPSLLLLSRAVSHLVSPPAKGQPWSHVWQLPGK